MGNLRSLRWVTRTQAFKERLLILEFTRFKLAKAEELGKMSALKRDFLSKRSTVRAKAKSESFHKSYSQKTHCQLKLLDSKKNFSSQVLKFR